MSQRQAFSTFSTQHASAVLASKTATFQMLLKPTKLGASSQSFKSPYEIGDQPFLSSPSITEKRARVLNASQIYEPQISSLPKFYGIDGFTFRESDCEHSSLDYASNQAPSRSQSNFPFVNGARFRRSVVTAQTTSRLAPSQFNGESNTNIVDSFELSQLNPAERAGLLHQQKINSKRQQITEQDSRHTRLLFDLEANKQSEVEKLHRKNLADRQKGIQQTKKQIDEAKSKAATFQSIQQQEDSRLMMMEQAKRERATRARLGIKKRAGSIQRIDRPMTVCCQPKHGRHFSESGSGTPFSLGVVSLP